MLRKLENWINRRETWNALESSHLILWAVEDHVQAGREDRVVPAGCPQRLGRGWNQHEQKGREEGIAYNATGTGLCEVKRKTGMEGRSWFCQTVIIIQFERIGKDAYNWRDTAVQQALTSLWVSLITDKRFISTVQCSLQKGLLMNCRRDFLSLLKTNGYLSLWI